MELLVMSDSHGARKNIDEALSRQIKKPDAILFLGDGLRDIAYTDLGGATLFAVCGNNDLYPLIRGVEVDEELVFTLGDKKIMMVHGHKYGVKAGLQRLLLTAAAREADIVLYGHTHEKYEAIILPDNEYGVKTKKPIYVMNPGAIGDYRASWGNITIDSYGRVLTSHGEL